MLINSPFVLPQSSYTCALCESSLQFFGHSIEATVWLPPNLKDERYKECTSTPLSLFEMLIFAKDDWNNNIENAPK